MPGPATTTPVVETAPPCRSVVTAPASAAIRTPAAMSQRVEVLLEVGVEPAARREAQVERGGSVASDVADVRDHRRNSAALGPPAIGEVAEPGADQRHLERRRFGDRERYAVERRPGSASRREHLAEHRRVHRAGDRTLRIDGGHRRAPHRQVVHEVDGAVDRVEVPVDPGGARDVGALLADDPVVGPQPPQLTDDQGLGRTIELGDRIGDRRLGVVQGRLAHAEAAASGQCLRAGCERETLGEPAEVVGARLTSDSSRRVPGVGAILDLAPFAHRPHHEHGHDGHPDRRGDRSDQQPDALGEPAVAVALEVDE